MARCPNCGHRFTPYGDLKRNAQGEYPRAFEHWTREENEKVRALILERKTVLEISAALGRQPSAVNKRVEMLGLTYLPPLPTAEQPVDRNYVTSPVVSPETSPVSQASAAVTHSASSS